MSNNTSGQDARAALKQATIGELRALAKFHGVKSEKTWKAEDYIKNIAAVLSDGSLSFNASANEDDDWHEELPEIADYSTAPKPAGTKDDKPAPGFARIVIHKDPTPGHANSPVQVGLNGRIFHVPRGKEVDIPYPYIGVLKDAVNTIISQSKEPTSSNPAGEMKEEAMLTYPFQVVAVTPGGKFVNVMDQRGQIAVRKQAFADANQKYPATTAELIAWETEERAYQRTKQR